MKLRRRWIPPIFAILTTGIWIALIAFDAITEHQASQLTLLNLGIGYAVKTGGFWYMRHRMLEDSRKLTIFGLSIIDFFLALIIFSATLTVISFALFFIDGSPSLAFRLFNRLSTNLVIWLIIGTEAAVIYEMRRAPLPLEVHTPDEP